MGKRKENKTPKGIMRSAVPLPCFFDVVKSQTVAGQRPRQGTKSCRMGRNSVRPSVCPSVRPSIRPSFRLPPSGWPSDPAGWPSDPSSWPSDPLYGRRTDGRMDGRNFSPFYRTLSPVGAAALLPFATSPHQRSRARVLLTSWCLLAFYLHMTAGFYCKHFNDKNPWCRIFKKLNHFL